MTNIRELVEQVRPVVTLPDPDQRKGYWPDDGRCCVGARLAHALDVPGGYYLKGVDEFARRMGETGPT